MKKLNNCLPGSSDKIGAGVGAEVKTAGKTARKSMQKGIKILFALLIMLLSAISGPSEKRRQPYPDGSCSFEENTPKTDQQAGIPPKEALKYQSTEMEIDGDTQAVFVLELDLSNPDLKVFPVLAGDRIFGFELLSEMGRRYEADAVVNAGFNFSYGQPSGLVIQNGKILSGSIGYGITLLIREGKAWFQNNPVKVWVETEEGKLPIDRINPYPEEKGILVYTPEYGSANRIKGKASTCIVKDDIVISSGETDGEVSIPRDGFLIVDLRTGQTPVLEFFPGQRVKLLWDGDAEQGYQCSGPLVENGVNVAGNSDPWAGNLGIHAPRTAVGIKDENTLFFVVVDGRQPGYSRGVTGKQLADIMITLGASEAAILDGGASSEMIVGDAVVNKPSTGKERLLASGFVVCYSADIDVKTPISTASPIP